MWVESAKSPANSSSMNELNDDPTNSPLESEETKEENQDEARASERPDVLANVDTNIELPEAADWGTKMGGTKDERVKARKAAGESAKKKKTKSQKDEERKRKLMMRKMRIQTSHFPVNLLWLGIMCCCGFAPIIAIVYYYQQVQGGSFDYIMPNAEADRLDLLKATIWFCVGTNAGCVLLTCYGLLAVTSKTLGQMKKYMRWMAIIAMLLFLPALVLIAYNILNPPVDGGAQPFAIWGVPLDPVATTQSTTMTALVLLGLDELLGFLSIGVAYYAALMYRDELKEGLRNRELERAGKRPRPPRYHIATVCAYFARITPTWARVCWSLVPSRAKIIWLMREPKVGILMLVIAALLNIVIGGMTIRSGGAFNVASGMVRIAVAIYGFHVLRQRKWSRIFAYGRILTLLIMLLLVTSIAYMATLLDERAEAAAGGDAIDIGSRDFPVVFGVIGALEIILMFWCLWCSINFAHNVEREEAEEELREAEAELLGDEV